jgi:hypothetical protein
LKDTVVTTEYIYANYGGSTHQQEIRNFVIDAYNSWGTMYFLMAGQPSTVPMQYQTWYDESTPSDQYYSDFDDDWTHEVFVGRSTAEGATRVDLFIDKVLFYEKTPTMTDYLLKAGLFGFNADYMTPCEQLMETIAGYIPVRFTKNKVYDSYGGNHLNSVRSYLNAGQHLVAHADHGDIDWWGIGYYYHGTGMYSGDIDALTNTNKMSIVTTLACDVNYMDYTDCFSEHWVIYNTMKAGLAFNGNTRLGWYYTGEPAALSGQLVRDWWRGLFQNDKYILGETIIWSKHQFSTTGTDANLKKHCEWEFNLLGEPSIPIWTDTPLTLDASHPATLPTGPSTFTVHVASSGSPVNQAYVCLWKGSEVYLTGYTNTNGDVTFNPSPSTTGTMYVTATKHNYLPRESSATVQLMTVLVDGYCYYGDMSPANTVTVDLVNLNNGKRWQASTDANYYSKTLVPGDDINAGQTLRFIAKDAGESVNVTNHVVTTSEISTGHIQQNLILNIHYRDLTKFPWYQAQLVPGYGLQSGAAVGKMFLDYFAWNKTIYPSGPPSVYDQTWIYNNFTGFIVPQSWIDVGLNWYDDPTYISAYNMWLGLQWNAYQYGYNFWGFADATSDIALAQICALLDYLVLATPGHPTHAGAAIPAYGDYSRWMAIRGIHTNKDAYVNRYSIFPGLGGNLSNLTISGFWINDPSVAGIGQNTYKTTTEFLTTYFKPMNLPGTPFENGKYTYIVEPPAGFTGFGDADGTTVTIAHQPGGYTASQKQVLQRAAQAGKNPFADQILYTVARESVDSILTLEGRSLAGYNPVQVTHVDSKVSDDYTIVVFSNGADTVAIRLDAASGKLLEFSESANAAGYLAGIRAAVYTGDGSPFYPQTSL